MWIDQYRRTIEEIKKYPIEPSILNKPEIGEPSNLYLSVGPLAIFVVLIREVEGIQNSIYYMSHVLREMHLWGRDQALQVTNLKIYNDSQFVVW